MLDDFNDVVTFTVVVVSFATVGYFILYCIKELIKKIVEFLDKDIER